MSDEQVRPAEFALEPITGLKLDDANDRRCRVVHFDVKWDTPQPTAKQGELGSAPIGSAAKSREM